MSDQEVTSQEVTSQEVTFALLNAFEPQDLVLVLEHSHLTKNEAQDILPQQIRNELAQLITQSFTRSFDDSIREYLRGLERLLVGPEVIFDLQKRERLFQACERARVVTFQGDLDQGDPDISLAFITTDFMPQEVLVIACMINLLNKQRLDPSTSHDTLDPNQSAKSDDRINLLNEQRREPSTSHDTLDPDQSAKSQGRFLRLRSASLNWKNESLKTGSGDTTPTGGPGGRPVKPKGSTPTESDATIHFADPKLESITSKAVPGAKPVTVVVFDTIIDRTKLDTHPNPLLKDTLTVMQLHPRLVVTSGSPGAYDMPHHGIFIAGLIHSIAPTANIYLYQVLDDKGQGNLESFTNAANQMIEDLAGHKPMIINCSFVFKFPSECDLVAIVALKDAIQHAYNTFSSRGSTLIVAAAGNDGVLPLHPEANVAASFDNVVGVGALDTSGQPAQYSNLADKPVTAGIWTFGGNIDPSSSPVLTDATKGILGIGRAPDEWILWSGTSFAAPIVSGALACLAAQPVERPSSFKFTDLLNELRMACEKQEGGEYYLKVSQG